MAVLFSLHVVLLLRSRAPLGVQLKESLNDEHVLPGEVEARECACGGVENFLWEGRYNAGFLCLVPER